MPGRRASDSQKREFWALVGGGVTPTAAARRVGMSATWGFRQTNGALPSRSIIQRELLEERQPEPKSFDQLDGGVKDLLLDFNAFSQVLLLRRSVPWRQDAARRVVDALQDRTERSFLVVSVPPGAGKSTLMTHDLVAWLICGGGFEDPARGRALRAMLGSFGMSVATHYVSRLKRLLESSRPYYSKETGQTADFSLTEAFGRFKPRQVGATWRGDEFTVEQFGDLDLLEKEPTVQAASREKGFLGERVDFASWDDLVSGANIRTPEIRAELAEWFGDEAETRIEPGGVGLLVGQRLAPDDLYRNRLDVKYVDAEGTTHRKYAHIVYPAHRDDACDNDHRQSDGVDGCLLDAERLPWKELEAEKESNPRKFRMVYQQEDVDPAGALVDEAWLKGGLDREGFESPGCYDATRTFNEWPQGVGPLVNYVTVDPSAGGYWGFLWFAYQPESKARFLIRGLRTNRFSAGHLLQYDQGAGKLTGILEDWQRESVEAGHRIGAWVLEANSAFQHLLQYDHFRQWQHKWGVIVVPHKTGLNKRDSQTGVEALLPNLFRQGLMRIPRGDSESLRFAQSYAKELVSYPEGLTSDLVMATWFSEWNMARILSAARREQGAVEIPDLKLPPYLHRQSMEIAMGS
jgi:hypothetical protein